MNPPSPSTSTSTSTDTNSPDYTKTLTQVFPSLQPSNTVVLTQEQQISTNLANAQKTFGRGSAQYQTILQMLRECLRDIELVSRRGRSGTESRSVDVDPEVLGVAMGILNLGS